MDMRALMASMGKPQHNFVQTIAIPEENIVEILTLADQQETLVGRYNLWKRMGELFPETMDGEWLLNTSDILHPLARKYDDAPED
jgi:hypothetical protein